MPAAAVNPLDRFKLATSLATPRIIAASVGGPGAGKTEFWLGAKPPIVFMSLDHGLEGVVDKYQERYAEEHEGAMKDIRVVEYDWSPTKEDEAQDGFKDEAIKLRNKFIEDFEFACKHARTVVWDKETDVWNLFRYAEFGTPKADVPRDFDKVNQTMRKYVNYPKKLTINFGLIQDVKEEWASQNKKTGGVKRAGFREVEGLIHVDLWHERREGKFYTLVGKARGKGAADVQDKEFENFTFTQLGIALFPDTEVEDWE
jgi:hypothetical protein